ncbi:MAG: glycosyltransferase family 2 protein [Victivallaceae bacterium]|nr:glycosyltransferase family 2 protein [Victivallaceae bacterium]
MISVCMATYNGEKFIKEQLQSILMQLSKDDEVIISDDSSEDSTLDLAYAFMDDRIKVFPGNFRNPIFNFENALNKASGEYIFLADQDDIWEENKVKESMKALKDNLIVVSDAKIVDESGKTLEKSFFTKNHSGPGFLRNLYNNSYIGCCIAFRSELLSVILPFPKKIAMHDIWIGYCVEFFGMKREFLRQPLISYRKHGQNVSNSGVGFKSGLSNFYRIQYRLRMLVEVIKRRIELGKKGLSYE